MYLFKYYFNNKNTVGGILLILIGLSALLFQIPKLQNIYVNTNNFKKTTGKVVSSYKENHNTYYGSESYIVKIQYRYVVNNNPYLSNTISLNDPYSKYFNVEEDALQFKDQYKLYSSIDVYYNPEEPTKSILLQEKFKYSIFDLLKIPPLLIIFGLSVLLSIKFRVFNHVKIFVIILFIYFVFT